MSNNSCAGGGGTNYPSDCDLTQALLEKARERNEPIKRSAQWQEALPRAKKVKILLLDVDGVLTDGTIIYTHDGGESKGFNTQDGFGLRILQDSGVEVGLITARTSEAVNRRAADLKLRHVYQGTKNKKEAFAKILSDSGLQPDQVAYMGDDWLDLPLLTLVGLAVSPANGVPEVQKRVHYITEKPGGKGAVRELCDLILDAQNKQNTLLKGYLK